MRVKSWNRKLHFLRACHQLKDFVAKMVGFENRIARILKAYF